MAISEEPDGRASLVDVAGASLVDVAGASLVDVAGASLVDVAGASLVDVAGASLVDVAGASLVDVAGASLVDVAGASLVDVAGASLVDVAGASLVDVAGASLVDVVGASLVDVVGASLVDVVGASLVDVAGASLVDVVGASLVDVAGASLVDVVGASLVDVAEFIDEQPVGGFQLRLLLTCAAVLFLDGFDTQAIGYVAPAIAKEWGLTKGALGPVFSAGLFGLMIGALLFGPLADRIGRKKIIVFSTIAFGIGTLITAFVHGVDMLLTMRFLTGLGLGGAMPNAVAMTSEFNPRRRRATMVMIMFCGFSVGAALGGFLAAALIPKFGWRSVFIVGGAAPLLLAPILMLRLPESVRFLVLTGRAHRRVAELLALISPKTLFASATQFVVREPELTGIPVVHLFNSGRTLVTLLLWVVFFMSLLDLYFLSNWLPTVLNDLGASVSEAAVIGSMLQVGGIVGTFALGSIIDRFSFRALALVYFIAVFAVGAIGQLGHSAVLVTMAIFAAGFCIVGGQIAANALAAGFYPTAVRATGVGWALGIGRVGSIVGPLVGGALLSMKWSAADVFITAAVAALCAALAAFSLSRLVATGGGGWEGRADQVSPFHDTLHPVTTART